ncbi:hypothetical protein WJX73_008835 [Symbiochloris irregularis]|uniref:Uncharacterized protein n=1 Tax=Symbiochloris irregularis TaxID=706552 RepID=A0AAW1PC79_9CHLO
MSMTAPTVLSGRVGLKAGNRSLAPRPRSRAACCGLADDLKATVQRVASKAQEVGKLATVLGASALVAGSASALTFDQLQGLTYLQVKGSGIANTCPVLEGGSSDLKDLKAGTYKINGFCMEPTSFTVKEEGEKKGSKPEFVKTKLMTRLTYTLAEMSGTFKVDGGGNVELQEEDGLDYAAVTVQLPGGERVPFLFTVKELNAKGPANAFGGDFVVPSYRGSTFLDPKGRGGSTGYDNAVALPARADSEELAKENAKSVVALKGEAVFSIAKIDPSTGEIAGVFESIQPSDTDLGSKAPKDVKVAGLWYGQLSS